MEEVNWVPTTQISSLSVTDLHRVQSIFLTETGENYQLENLRRLPVSESAGSQMIIDTNGVIHGVLWAMNVDHHTTRILGFCITKKYQRIGLGKLGWDKFAAIAKSNGRRTVYLEVRESNQDAIRFYKKRGLEEIGALSNYYQGSKGIVMQGSL
jgi:ribosomal protein S18 acetylase RimI-like enzyme